MSVSETGRRDYRDSTIVDLFEAQARQSPDALAIVTGDQKLPYLVLNARANQLARLLRGLGVGPETFVGVCLERSVDLVVALLGTLKAGGVYVPLDPHYPAERLSFMVRDTEAPVLLTNEPFLSRLAGVGGRRVVCLDSCRQEISTYPKDDLPGKVSGDNLAFVLYTSGSMGQPKGVLMEHKGFCNLSAIHRQAFGLGKGSRVLLFGAPSHGNAVIETVVTLSTGATLCVEPYESLVPGPALLRVLRECGVTNLHIPPTALAALPVEPLPSLRVLTVGGEPLPKQLVSRWAKGRRFFNSYGTTETNWLAFTELHDGDDTELFPVGRPIANVEAYIVDTELQPLPQDSPGELYIGGIGLARGYLNRPELTAEKFIQNPFSSESGARLYKTGDLARYLPDGNIEFLGRLDHQVKIRGFRIELEEIELALGQHPAVQETVVLAREDGPDDSLTPLRTDKRLVAYVVADQQKPLTISDLRSFLKEKLPDYMVPSAFVMLDALPLLPNGKLDRKALPVPDKSRPTLDTPFVAARTPVEKDLATIWAEVLSLDQVGINDKFFDLGGHSLRAVQVISRVINAFKLELPIKFLLESPTIADMTVVITQNMANKAGEEELSRMLAELESITDKEAQRRLEDENK